MSLFYSLYCYSHKMLFNFAYPSKSYHIISLKWSTIHYTYTHSINKIIELATLQVYTKIYCVLPTATHWVHWTHSVMFWHSTSRENTQHHHALGRCRSSVHTDHSSSSPNSVCTDDSVNACVTLQSLNHLIDTNWLGYHWIHLSELGRLG